MKSYIGPVALLVGILIGGMASSYLLPSNEDWSLEKDNDSPDYTYLNNVADIKEEYNIDAEGFSIHHDEIQKNQFLSDILLNCNVDYATIEALAKKADSVYKVTRLRAGKPYYILSDTASQKARYMIYEDTPIDYVVFEMQDSLLNVYTAQKEIETRVKMTSGIIEANLSQTMADNHCNSYLAIALSEVMAWSIDFFRLEKGDRYKTIYEEKFVNGRSVGIGDVLAVYFHHRGSDFFAFQYEQDSIFTYFDEEGNSVRKAFLKAPIKFSRISSRFSHRRFHPVLQTYRGHFGTDYAAPTGTPIRSVGDGIVTARTYSGGNGNYVKIRHNATYSTQYLHLSRFGKGIAVGKSVKQGQVIGYVGSTGLATGPHLCYRFWKNGKQVDPYKEKLPPAAPINPEIKDAYMLHKDSIIKVLIDIPFQRNYTQEDLTI